MNWRKIRDTSKMNRSGHQTANLNNVHEVVAWPDVWVLRGGTTSAGHVLYGLDIQANRLVWTIAGLNCPEGLGWSFKSIPLLAQTGDLAVVATYVGRNREHVWLLAVEPHTAQLVWRKRLAWHRRTGGGTLYGREYIGIAHTGHYLLVMENRAQRGEDEQPILLWLDPATGETLHECPAPEIEDPAIIACDHIHLPKSSGWEFGLFRVPVAPGADGVEQLMDRQVTSLRARDDRLYAMHAEDRADWTFTCFDACTFEQEYTHKLDVGEGGKWPRLMAVDPARPDHVVLKYDTRLWGFDLPSGETLWQHTFEYSTSVKQLLPAPYGALLNADRGVERLDLLTGERSDLGIGDAIELVFPVGDYLLTSRSFGGGCDLYVLEGTDAAAVHPDAVSGDETWSEHKLRALLPDLLTDPRDELEAAFTRAAGRGSLNTLFKQVRQVTRISQTHKKVKDFFKALKAGELDAGPLNFTPLAELHRGFFFYPDLFGFGPDERFFPGVLIAGEYGGVEFYLMWATGQVIALHHDASFYEVAGDVWHEAEERVGRFEREFPEQGGVLDIAQLVRFQRTFSELESTGELSDLDARDFFTRTAEAFGWSLGKLYGQLNEHRLPLEFLSVHDEELEILESMVAQNQ